MCNTASGILSKDRAFWLPNSDSHTDILEHYGLHQDGSRGPNLLQYEIVPQPGADILDLDTWKYRVDQDVLPDWYDAKECETRARAALKKRWPRGIAKDLTTLYASYSKITDVSKLVNLTTLYASYSEITDVSKLVNLTTLYANGSKITDVSKLVNLTTLYAHCSKITDVSKLVNLTTLYASYSKITDVSKLVNLTTLYASDSKITGIREGCTVYR